MDDGGAATHPGTQAPAQPGWRWIRPVVPIAVGVLLLAIAAVQLAPYVDSRLHTASLVSSRSDASPVVHTRVPAPTSDRTPTDGVLAEAREAGPTDAVSDKPVESEQASVALVPTPRAPPTRLVIPAISVDAQIVPSSQRLVSTEGILLTIPRVPATSAAGWHSNSAALGIPGNTVLSGHNTGNGEVFRDLYLLEEGDEIIVYSGDTPYTHTISKVVLLREEDQPVEVRRRNARYVEPTNDERLTLVTCHPYGSLRYRLVVVARPGVSPTGVGSRRAPEE